MVIMLSTDGISHSSCPSICCNCFRLSLVLILLYCDFYDCYYDGYCGYSTCKLVMLLFEELFYNISVIIYVYMYY